MSKWIAKYHLACVDGSFLFLLQKNWVRKCPLDTYKYAIFPFILQTTHGVCQIGNGTSGLFLHWQTDSLSHQKSISTSSYVYVQWFFFQISFSCQYSRGEHIANTRPTSCTTNASLPMPDQLKQMKKKRQINNNTGRKCTIVENFQIKSQLKWKKMFVFFFLAGFAQHRANDSWITSLPFQAAAVAALSSISRSCIRCCAKIQSIDEKIWHLKKK